MCIHVQASVGTCSTAWGLLLLFPGSRAQLLSPRRGGDNLPVGQGLQGGVHVAGVPQVLHAREAWKRVGREVSTCPARNPHIHTEMSRRGRQRRTRGWCSAQRSAK